MRPNGRPSWRSTRHCGDEARGTGAKIFFADEAHFRADAELRGKWVLRGEPALVDSTSPRYGEKASYYSAVCLETGEVEWMDLGGEQQLRNVGSLPGTIAGEALRAVERDLGQRSGAPWRGGEGVPADARAEPAADEPSFSRGQALPGTARTSMPMRRSGAGQRESLPS